VVEAFIYRGWNGRGCGGGGGVFFISFSCNSILVFMQWYLYDEGMDPQLKTRLDYPTPGPR